MVFVFIIHHHLLSPTCFWIQSFLYLCVQEDDAVVVWGRLQSHCPDLQPHQSWLVPEDTRVILTLIPSEDQRCCYGTVSKFAPPKKGCGWVLCFHVYQKAAVQVQVSLQPTLRGTFWSIWPRTVRQSLRSGSSESKSMTCQRQGKDALLQMSDGLIQPSCKCFKKWILYSYFLFKDCNLFQCLFGGLNPREVCGFRHGALGPPETQEGKYNN